MSLLLITPTLTEDNLSTMIQPILPLPLYKFEYDFTTTHQDGIEFQKQNCFALLVRDFLDRIGKGLFIFLCCVFYFYFLVGFLGLHIFGLKPLASPCQVHPTMGRISHDVYPNMNWMDDIFPLVILVKGQTICSFKHSCFMTTQYTRRRLEKRTWFGMPCCPCE